MVFDGSELLRFAVASIRKQVDFISVVYQTTSYFGNPADPDLSTNVETADVDQIVHVNPDLSLHHKVNELNYRNLGLDLSIAAGCTHHISADVDEFYLPDQLEYAKSVMGDSQYSMAPLANYYKDPRFLIMPDQKQLVTFIHPVGNRYEYNKSFPFKIEITRRFVDGENYRLFSKEEVMIHHMSYVRKDIRRKLMNSDNGRLYKKMDEFAEGFDKYQLGDRLCIVPDFKNRKTVLVENIFGITL